MSNLVNGFTDGPMQHMEESTRVVPFAIGNSNFRSMYLLTDGIYPKYSRFLKTIPEPNTLPQKYFAQWQEGAQKDIERAFGVLQGRFQFMAKPMHMRDLSAISKRVQTCLILHNMGVSDRVMGEVNVKYDPSFVGEAFVDNPANTTLVVEGGPTTTLPTMDSSSVAVDNRWNRLIDETEHKRLLGAFLRAFKVPATV
jgi:hypothetical protein